MQNFKRQIRAARKAKTLRLARWSNVPYMRSKFALADLRDRNHWSHVTRDIANAVQS